MPFEEDLQRAAAGGLPGVDRFLVSLPDETLDSFVWQCIDAYVAAFALSARCNNDTSALFSALRSAAFLCSRMSPREVVTAVLERASCRDESCCNALPLILQLLASSAMRAAAGPRPFKPAFLRSIVFDVDSFVSGLAEPMTSLNIAAVCSWTRAMVQMVASDDHDVQACLSGLSCGVYGATLELGLQTFGRVARLASVGTLSGSCEGIGPLLEALLWAGRGVALTSDASWAARALLESRATDEPGTLFFRLRTRGARALVGLGLLIVDDLSGCFPASADPSAFPAYPSTGIIQPPSILDAVEISAIAFRHSMIPRVYHPEWLVSLVFPPLTVLLQALAQNAAGARDFSEDAAERQAERGSETPCTMSFQVTRALACVDQLLRPLPATSVPLSMVLHSDDAHTPQPLEALLAQAVILLAVHSGGKPAVVDVSLRVLRRLIVVLVPGGQRVVLRALLAGCPYPQAQAVLLDLVRQHAMVGARGHDRGALPFAAQLLLQTASSRIQGGLTREATTHPLVAPADDALVVAAHLASRRDVDCALLSLFRALLLLQRQSTGGVAGALCLAPDDVTFLTTDFAQPLSSAVSGCLRALAPPSSLAPHSHPFSVSSNASAVRSTSASAALTHETDHLLSAMFLLDAALAPVMALL